MIKGMHVTYFTSHAGQMRTMLKDKLGVPFTDVGGGWLIFDTPNSEIAAHPIYKEGCEDDEERPTAQPGGSFAEISFFCDDLEATMREMKKNGVEFIGDIEDKGYGLIARFRMTDDVEVDLYQPRYQRKPASAAAKPRGARRSAGGKATPQRASQKKK